jgi:hypothetical protein
MSLVKAHRDAQKAGPRKKEFTIAGEKISLPRLDLEHQADFEAWMQDRIKGDFSLSQIANKAAFKYASLLQSILTETQKQYTKEELRSKMTEKQRAELEAKIRDGLEPYLDTLMSKLDSAAQSHAIYLAMRQEFGAVYKDDEGEMPITEETVNTLLEITTNGEKNSATLYVLGLQEFAEEIKKKAETPQEMIEELGDPLSSKNEQSEKSTGKSSSLSSQPTTEKTNSGSGSKQQNKSSES